MCRAAVSPLRHELAVDVVVISLRSDEFVDIKPIPYAAKALGIWRSVQVTRSSQ